MESKTVGTIKTVLIILLFLGAIIMSYLSFDALQKRYGDETVTELAQLTAEGLSDTDRLPESFILPEIVAVKKSGAHMNAISSGAEYMNDIYRLIAKNIVFADAGCTSSPSDDSTFFDTALSSDDFIYVRYHTSLPFALILLDAVNAEDRGSFDFDNEHIKPQVHELLIIPSDAEKGKTFAYIRDTNGECIKCTANENADKPSVTLSDDFDIYVEASALTTADFYGMKSPDQTLLPTTVLFASGLNSRKISTAEGADGITSDTELQNKLALMLDINPSKTGSYYDSENDMTVYIPTHGELSISSDEIVYSTDHNESGGVLLSELIGSDAEHENYSLYKRLLAADKLIRKIKEANSALLGDEAEPILTKAYRDGDLLTLEYGYFFSNIELPDMPIACKITMSKDKLTRLEIHPISVTFSVTDRIRCMPQSLITSVIEKDGIDGDPYSCTLIYRYRNDGELLTAEWELAKIN